MRNNFVQIAGCVMAQLHGSLQPHIIHTLRLQDVLGFVQLYGTFVYGLSKHLIRCKLARL